MKPVSISKSKLYLESSTKSRSNFLAGGNLRVMCPEAVLAQKKNNNGSKDSSSNMIYNMAIRPAETAAL